MRSSVVEVVDLTLTQSIERYLEMSAEEAYQAIVKEWPEQTAILLVEFLFKTTCTNCGKVPDFIEIGRESGNNYIATLCDCEVKPPQRPN